MAKTANPAKTRQRAKSGLLTRRPDSDSAVGICAQLYTLRGQVERAQTDQGSVWPPRWTPSVRPTNLWPPTSPRELLPRRWRSWPGRNWAW